MHELSLAQSVVGIVTEEAGRHGLRTVERITLRVGALRGVVPEAMLFCMEHVTRGSVAEGAEVTLVPVAGQARCPACAHEFPIPDYLFSCPRCGRVGGEVIAGEELAVIGLEGAPGPPDA